MKILVIDDTAVHLDAARQTLDGHDVTYCATHEQAVDLLSVRYDEARKDQLCKQYQAQGLKFNEYYDKVLVETRLPYWDVVLTDLLMPAGSMAQGGVGLQYVGQEMAVGWALALQAAKEGAKYVAVVTDTNHHHHPASAMLDDLNGHFFTIDGARVLMTNYVFLVGITGTETTCTECGGSGKVMSRGKEYSCHSCTKGQVFAKKGKNWGQILEQMLKGPSQE
ncbi:MAG: hypothetical protein KBB77_01400 [Candidatus Moranbacteria bacterium]|nr:hypothetical protein [Candidatus Moranbacteria bacterium]